MGFHSGGCSIKQCPRVAMCQCFNKMGGEYISYIIGRTEAILNTQLSKYPIRSQYALLIKSQIMFFLHFQNFQNN